MDNSRPLARGWVTRLPQWLVAVLPVLGVLAAASWALLRISPRVPNPTSFYPTEAWPFPSLDELQSYGRSSPVGPLLVFAFGLEDSPWLAVFRLAMAALAVALMCLWVYGSIDVIEQRTRGMRLMLLAPLTALLILIIGSYDPYTVIGLALALFAWRRGSILLMTFAGIYLGFQHFEQAVISVTAVALLAAGFQDRLPSRLRGCRSIVWTLPGILAGKLVLMALLAIQDVSATEGRAYWLTSSWLLKQAFVGSVNFAPVLLVSFCGGLWALVILGVTRLSGRRQALLVLGSLALLMAVAVITLDHTRVFAITSGPWLAVLIATLLSDREVVRDWRLLLVVESMAWLVPPLVVQGVDRIYVADLNALDQWVMFIQGYLPLG